MADLDNPAARIFPGPAPLGCGFLSTIDDVRDVAAPGRPRGDLRWSTFLKSHARGIFACDFFVSVTATFRVLYEFVVIKHGTRRLAHVNVTSHPSAAWTLQQLRG